MRRVWVKKEYSIFIINRFTLIYWYTDVVIIKYNNKINSNHSVIYIDIALVFVFSTKIQKNRSNIYIDHINQSI